MTDLKSCSIREVNEIIRVVVMTQPWSDINKFPVMKDITVIRSQGFGFGQSNNLNIVSDSDLMTSNEEGEDENVAFNKVLKNMRLQGYRLVRGNH
jgi:hypothetical protein